MLDFAFDPRDPDRIYITSDMVGVFASDDAGDHWKWSSSGASKAVGGIAIDPDNSNTLYSIGPEGIYKSVDKAKHWHLIYSKGNGYNGINGETFGPLRQSIFGRRGQSITVGPHGTVYASTTTGDVLISRNKGRAFEKVRISGGEPVKRVLPVNAEKIVAGLSGGVYLSGDKGRTWEKTLHPPEGGLLAIAAHPENRHIIFALTGKYTRFTANADHFPAYLYKSMDGGKNWELMHLFKELAINKVRRIMDVGTDGTIVILSAHGPLRSLEGSGTWTLSRIEGREDDGFIYYIKGRPVGPLSVYADPRNAGRWYMTNMTAAFRSDDNGKTWHYKVRGLREQAYWFVKVNPADPDIIIASDLDYGLIRSTDGGLTWRDGVIIDPYEECDQLRFLQSDRTYSTLYGFFFHPYPFIARSTDKGATWRVLKRWENKRRMSMQKFCLTEGEGHTAMYVGEPNVGIWKSDDEGRTWTIMNNGLPKADEMNHIQFLESDPRGYIYVGIASRTRGKGGIFTSVDGGETWFPRNRGLEALFVRRGSLEIDPNDPDVLWVGAGRGVYKSIDGGESWSKKIGNVYASSILVEPEDSDNVYVASYTGGGIVEQYTAGIYKSVDGGNYFININGDLSRSIGSSYRVLDLEYGWRGTGGIWAAPDGGGLIHTIPPFTPQDVK